MTTKTKGRAGWNQATQETTSKTHSSDILASVKAFLIGCTMLDATIVATLLLVLFWVLR